MLPYNRQAHKQKYIETLKRVFNERVPTIREVKFKKKKTNDGNPLAPNEPNDSGFDVFGVLRVITSNKATPFCANSKEILINDPTDDAGIKVLVKGRTDLLFPGNMVRLKEVKTVTEGNESETNQYRRKFEVDASNLKQFQSFSYDYQQHTNHDVSDYAAQPFDGTDDANEDDETLCEVLETWLSSEVLAKQFSVTIHPTTHKLYIDCVAQIIEQRMMRGSLVLTLWDGSTPTTSIDDPYKAEYSATYTQYNNNYCVRTNDSVKPFVPLDKQVYINVWKNVSNTGNEHFERAAQFQLKDGDDLVLMFNLEVTPNRLGTDYPVTLNMRSGLHQGKSIRLVKRHSVLGEGLMETLDKLMDTYKMVADLSDGDITEDSGDKLNTSSVGVQVQEVTSDDRLFEFEVSGNFQDIPQTRASTPSSPDRKRRTLGASSPKTPTNQVTEVEPVQGTSVPIEPPASSEKVQSPKSAKASPCKTVITIDMEDEEIKSLISKLPPHISFNTLVAMEFSELEEYESLLDEVGDWVEADIRDFGNQLSREALIDIIRLAKAVKGQEEQDDDQE